MKFDFNCLLCGSDLKPVRHGTFLECTNDNCKANYTIPKIERALLRTKVIVSIKRKLRAERKKVNNE